MNLRAKSLARAVLSILLVAGLVFAASAAVADTVRVATLLPFVEDALRQAPGNAEVVATVRRSLHEPPREGVADLGNPHSPSLEQLAAARPDLIVGDASIHARFRGKLARFGAEVLLIDTSSVEGTWKSLGEIGRKVGGEAEMQAAIDRSRSGVEKVSLAKPTSALVLFGAPGTFYAMTERTWLGDLAARLGYENAAPDLGSSERFPGLIALSDEVVAGLSPDVVLLVAHGDPRAIQAALEKKIERGGAWRGLQRASVVRVLNPQTFAANPGLGMAQAAQELAGVASPAVATGP